MAKDRIKGINIKIGADTTGLDEALSSIDNKSKSTRGELTEINRSLNKNKDSVVLWEQKQELLSKAFDISKEKLNMLESAQKDVNKQLEDKAITGEQYRAFQRELENARAEAKRFGGQLEDAENKVKELNGTADKTAESVHDLGDDIHKSGEQAQESADGGFTVLKGAIADLASDAIKAAADAFKELASEGEEALNTIQTRTGATAEEMQQYSEVMSNLYANNFGEDKADLAESISSVKQQLGELSPEELEKITERAILMRDTFGYDVAESIRTVKMLMDQFEVSAEEAYTLIAQGSQKGLDKNGDLLDTLNEYSVHYKTMGYSAEEFFNSLMNGTEAGTFSVDKLGDAMKEFGIRTKDGSDSTTNAFIAIGLAAGDNSEEIKKAQDSIEQYNTKITDLEDKLKYAKIQQSEFTDKTSELTKIKLEDNIAKWSKELEESKNSLSQNESALAAMIERSQNGGQSVDDLFARFASGGDEAKEATEEVMNALFSMEDKVAQDAAGVALFGTMWEDLGKDGVSALMDVRGEADKTAATLEDINKVKYDSAKSQFEQLKRKIITDLLEPAAQKLIPKIEDGTEWLVKNLPDILETGKKLLPVVTGVGTAFAAWKIGQKVKSLADFNNKVKESGGLLKNITGLISGNPFGAIAAGVGIATTAISYFSDSIKVGKTETEKFIEEQEKYQQAAQDSIDEIENLRREADENAVKIDIEYDDIQKKWDELQTLVDQNGKIKEGYEARVNYIANELTEATGVEIDLVDGQIQKYNELKDTIEKTIDKQRAQRLFENYSANEAEYIQKRDEAEQEYFDRTQDFKETEQIWNEAKNNYDKVLRDLYESRALQGKKNMSFEKFLEEYDDVINNDSNVINARAAKMRSNSKYVSAEQSMKIAQEKFFTADSEINRLLHAEELIAEERYKEASHYMTALNDEYKKTVADVKAGENEKVEAYNDSLKKFQSDLSLARESGSKGNKESARDMVDTVSRSLAEMTGMMISGGADSGTIYSKNFKEIVQSMLDSGVDFSTLEGYFADAGIDLGTVLGNSIQYGISDSLTNIGESISGLFSGLARGIYSRAVDPQPLPQFATGGFLSSGRGIVAEAGPELIEIINGGAKITPLTGSARNTPVASAGSSRNVYINNTINASISGGYDVRRLAEDLAGEQRRVERNMGL